MSAARSLACALTGIVWVGLAGTASGASFSVVYQIDYIYYVGPPSMSADGSHLGYVVVAGSSAGDSLGHAGIGLTTPVFSADGSIAMGRYIPYSGPYSGDSLLYRIEGSTETTVATGAWPVALSDDGQRYVGYLDASHPFVADYAPGPPGGTPLADLPSGAAAQPLDISGDGRVIVGFGGSATSGSDREAARWDATGAVTGLGDLPGGAANSYANAASYDGTTIVGAGTSAAGVEAVRWRNDVIESLGLGAGSGANAVSADGSRIVGILGVGGSNRTAFYLDEGGTAVDLEALLQNEILGAGFVPATVDLTPTEISADGTIIAGYGTGAIDPFGTIRKNFIWKAVVPEPASAGLLAAGLAALGIARRHSPRHGGR